MEYQATTKYVRITPRKIRLLADGIRGMGTVASMNKLRVTTQPVAKLLANTLASALANAKQKQAAEDSLWIKTIEVMEGPVMKRWHAVSRGTAHSYKKRMAHIKIVLSDEERGKNKQIYK